MTTFELKTPRDAGVISVELEKITGKCAGTTVRGNLVTIDADLTVEQVDALTRSCEALDAQEKPKTLAERVAALEIKISALEKTP